jgi:hypothetical protein
MAATTGHSINTGSYGKNTEISSSLKLLHWLNLNCASIIGSFYVDRNSKTTTTAGHSFYIGPIGSFYNQVNDTGSWELLVSLISPSYISSINAMTSHWKFQSVCQIHYDDTDKNIIAVILAIMSVLTFMTTVVLHVYISWQSVFCWQKNVGVPREYHQTSVSCYVYLCITGKM